MDIMFTSFTYPFRLGGFTEEKVTPFHQFMKVHGLAFL